VQWSSGARLEVDNMERSKTETGEYQQKKVLRSLFVSVTFLSCLSQRNKYRKPGVGLLSLSWRGAACSAPLLPPTAAAAADAIMRRAHSATLLVWQSCDWTIASELQHQKITFALFTALSRALTWRSPKFGLIEPRRGERGCFFPMEATGGSSFAADFSSRHKLQCMQPACMVISDFFAAILIIGAAASHHFSVSKAASRMGTLLNSLMQSFA
jgi:hypothetical protein